MKVRSKTSPVRQLGTDRNRDAPRSPIVSRITARHSCQLAPRIATGDWAGAALPCCSNAGALSSAVEQRTHNPNPPHSESTSSLCGVGVQGPHSAPLASTDRQTERQTKRLEEEHL